MSLGGTQVDAIDVSAILNGVDEGVVVLPDFQRKFEWSEADTIAVLATILTKWPVGSLLLLEGAPTYLRTRPFNGVGDKAAAANHRVEYVVLDGQQRITSLFHALWDRGKRVFALNLKSLEADLTPENLEEAIETILRSKWEKQFTTPSMQLTKGYIPIYALRNPSEFFKWRDEALIGASEPSRTEQYDRISDLYRDLLSGLDRYRVPAIIVPKRTPPGAIARIFERVNKSGQKLKTFDLMVAVTYDGAFSLREEWDHARLIAYPIVGEFFGDNGMPALHAMSLRHAESLRDSAVLQMAGSDVRAHWVSAIRSLESVAVFARRYLGMNTVKDAPNINALLILAALSETYDLEAEHLRYERWFWAASFSGRYDVASNTRAASDFRTLRDTPNAKNPVVTFSATEIVKNTKRQGGALHRTFAAFLASRLDDRDQASLSELKFESVLRATVDRDAYSDMAVPSESTLSHAWKRTVLGSDERNSDSVPTPELQLLPTDDNYVGGDVVDRRLHELVSALQDLGIEAVIVATELD